MGAYLWVGACPGYYYGSIISLPPLSHSRSLPLPLSPALSLCLSPFPSLSFPLSFSVSFACTHTQIPIRKKETTTSMLPISRRGHHFPTEPSTMIVNTSYEIQCELHILTTFVIPDILLLLSFAYGLYIFRWKQTEQLSTLTETVGHPFTLSSSLVPRPLPRYQCYIQMHLQCLLPNPLLYCA